MLRSLLSLALALLGAGAEVRAQQLWLSQNDETTYNNSAVGWPASVIAFRFTAPSSASLVGAQIFTGNASPAVQTLELRADDPLTGLPGILLGPQASWTLVHTRSWQGATWPHPALVTAGQTYWLVWRVGGMFPQHSVSADTTPGRVLSEVRVSDGINYFAQSPLAAKFRLYTAHQGGTATPFGQAKPGQYGDPQIAVAGWQSIGAPLDVLLDMAARLQPALLFAGLPIQPGVPIGVGTIYTTSELVWLVTTRLQSNPSSGGYDLTIPTPNDPGLAGIPIGLQWAVLDPLAQDGLSHSAAVEVTLQ